MNLDPSPSLNAPEDFLQWMERVWVSKGSPPGDFRLSKLNPWFLDRGRTDFLTLKEKCTAKIISMANLKGGVGKSTLAANLGASLADQGKRVLLIDLDWQESLTRLTLTPNEVREFAQRMTPLVAQALVNYARTPRVPNWGALTAKPVAWRVSRTCANGGTLAILPTTNDLQIAEELALMCYFWSAKGLHDPIGPNVADPNGIYDCRFIVGEMISHWGTEFDYIINDCPPRLTAACVGALAASDVILMPSQQDPIALNGITHFLTRFVPQFTRVLWGGRSKMPTILAILNSVHWATERSARKTIRGFAEGFDQKHLSLKASNAIVPQYAGFRHASEDKSKDIRTLALDAPKANRVRSALAVLREEIEAL
jgi:cellulose biosynthesis protein BcsQ